MQANRPAGRHRAPAFLDSYRGPSVLRRGHLAHPVTLALFRDTFDATARNAHFLGLVAPALLRQAPGGSSADAPVRVVLQRARTALGQAQAGMAPPPEAGTADGVVPAVQARIVAPLSRDHWELLLQADTLLVHANLLWLEDRLTDTERLRVEDLVRRHLRAVALTARATCVAVRRQLRGGDTASGATAPA